MGLKIEITGGDLPSLAFEVMSLAESFRPLFDTNIAVVTAGAQESAVAAANPAPLNEPETDMPNIPANLRRDKAPASNPEKSVRADGADFIVKHASGRKKAGYKYGEDALEVLADFIAKASDIETLDKLTATNRDDLQFHLPEHLDRRLEELYDARYQALGADPSVDGGDGNDDDASEQQTPEEPSDALSADSIRARLQAFIQKGKAHHERTALILNELGAARFSELDESKYPDLLEKINAAEAELSNAGGDLI
jgi:hypothetical protein